MSNDLVIFDLGGVIVRNISIIDSIARTLGIDEDGLKSDYALYEKALMAGLFPIDTYYRHLEDRFGVRVCQDIFRTHFKPVLNEPMLSLADDLRARGVRCVIGSNTYQSHWWFIDEMGIREHFDACHASHVIHAVKPCAGFFSTILAIEGRSVEETHFIDDLPQNVMTACLMGIDGFCYQDDDEALRSHLGALLA